MKLRLSVFFADSTPRPCRSEPRATTLWSWWARVGLAGFLIAPVVACDSTSASEASTASTSADGASQEGRLRKVSGEEAKQLVQDGALLVDVRTPGEFAGGHAKGAVNIPVSDLRNRLGELDDSKPIVVYCRSGQRSHRAATLLEERGFSVADLGSLSDWPD